MSRPLQQHSRAPERPGHLWLGLLSLLFLCMLSRPGMTAEEPRVLIIFDGSGSMWGKLPGERQPKLVLAREALREVLPKVARQTQVGLAVFGHRRSGDCADVEVAARPAPLDAPRLLSLLERLNPKGKGPLSLAVGEAARALGAATEPGRIVLVHDDVDNCAPEPCTAIAEIAKIYPRLTVDLVSIGLPAEDAQRAACFARATGGRVYEAQSADEIVTALSQALGVSGAVANVPRPQPASRDVQPSARTDAPISGNPGVYLTASLVAGSEPVGMPVRWRVLRAADPGSLPVYDQEAVAPRLDLPAGRYDVEASLSHIAVRQTVDVDPTTAQRVNFALNAGTIRLSTTPAGGTGAAGGIVLTISKPENGAGGGATGRPGTPVHVSTAPQSEIALLPGPYVITISHGLFRTDRQIMVVAGTRGRLAIPLPTGEIELQAVAGQGGPPLADAVFQIFEDDPDAPRGRRELMRSAATGPSFTLPAGTYYVVARRGAAEARERITVRPGQIERRTLAIASARLTLGATVAGAKPDSGDSVLYRIERIDGAPVEVARLTQQTGALDLAPGRYRIESRLGPLNAHAERSIELKPGASENVTMDHQAGVVRLSFVEPGNAQFATDVFWEIRDQSGHTVWLTSEAQPLGVLQAGRYTVRAEHRDQRLEKQIEVRPGDNRVLELHAR